MSAGQLKVDRLMSLAFFPGRAPRSDAYREGCRAALAYRILGQKMPTEYAAGTCEADAWSAGVAEGHSLAKAGAPAVGEASTSAEQRLLKAWRNMDDRSQRFIGELAVAQAEDCPRRALASLHFLNGNGKAKVRP